MGDIQARLDLRESGAAMRRRLGLEPRPGRGTAPGLPDLLDEVVFGRVWCRPGLGVEDRMLATLSALTSRQHLDHLADYTRAAVHIGMEPGAVQEVMLHCAMYAGMPTAERSLEVVGAVLAELRVERPAVATEVRGLDELTVMGRATMAELHDERAEDGYAAPDSAASELYATAIDFLYGEIWNRPGLTRRQRMICSVAAFTATQMADQQRKFFRSALNVGLSRDEVIEIITQTGPYSGFPPALNALAVAEQALD